MSALAREKGKRAWRPQNKSIQCCTQAGEPTGNDSHYPKRDSESEPSGSNRHYPKTEPRLPNYPQHESPATMPHLAPQGREPSGGNRHYPKSEPGLPNSPQHESQATMLHPGAHRGASHREAANIIAGRSRAPEFLLS